MTHFTLLGVLADKDRLIEGLQEIGCAHIVTLRSGSPYQDAQPAGHAAAALAFLRASPLPWHPAPQADHFDPQALQDQALAVRERLLGLADERDAVLHRLRELEPWGDFELPLLDAHPELRFWFYVVPHYRLQELARFPYRWSVVNRDPRQSYVVVISAGEPALPFARAHTGPARLSAVRERLAAIAVEIDDLQAERARLARWRDRLAEALKAHTDHEQRVLVANLTCDGERVFSVAGWIPAEAEILMRGLTRRRGAALLLAAPGDAEEPPTLIETPAALAAGERLLGFYLMPGYRAWEPSAWVLIAFALFFALIVSDAAYALLLSAFTVIAWRRRPATTPRGLGPALLLVCVASVAWGAMAGSWFGLPPAPGSVAAQLWVFDLDDATRTMALAGVLGAVHLAVANVMVAVHLGALAPLGWALLFVAGAMALGTGALDGHPLGDAATLVAAIGAALVFLYTGSGRGLGRRLFAGLLALTRTLSALGDTLSYLRLYALALAGASLAGAVNDMAGLAGQGGGARGALLTAAVLAAGHGLNLALGVAGGLIHGLRLNFIEFLNWSVTYEGYPFRAFRKTT